MSTAYYWTFTTIPKLAHLFFLLRCPHPTQWSESRWVWTICLTLESITHIPHHAMKVVEWTLQFTLRSISEYRISYKTMFPLLVVTAFLYVVVSCFQFAFLALTMNHPGGAEWWPILYRSYLWWSPHHGRIGFLLLPSAQIKRKTLCWDLVQAVLRDRVWTKV